MAAADVTMRSKPEQLPPLGEAPSSPTNEGEEQPASGADWAGPPYRNTIDLNYMHRPPTIVPNYGKRKGVLKLKTNVPKVLLFDNVTQQSMLKVELSSLQSQQHKADRELNMQTRSFLLRRQFKNKALKNLTKVHHDHDYWEFEREYFGLPLNGELGSEEGGECFRRANGHGGHFLPSLNSGKGAGSIGGRRLQNGGNAGTDTAAQASRGRVRKQGRISDARWSATEANDRRARKGKEALNNGEDAAHREISLPHINVSPPGPETPQDSPTGGASNLHQFSPPRKVGFRFQKGPSGVTRIFHSHHAASEQDGGDSQPHETDAEVASPSAEEATTKLPAVDKNNNHEVDVTEKANEEPRAPTPPTSKAPFDSKIIPGRTRLTKVAEIRAAAETVIKEVEPLPEAQVNTTQPVLDYRFQDLHQKLVKQNPPNDGFIELSPSFIRDGPITQLRERIKNLNLDVGALNSSREGSAQSRRSDTDTDEE